MVAMRLREVIGNWIIDGQEGGRLHLSPMGRGTLTINSLSLSISLNASDSVSQGAFAFRTSGGEQDNMMVGNGTITIDRSSSEIVLRLTISLYDLDASAAKSEPAHYTLSRDRSQRKPPKLSPSPFLGLHQAPTRPTIAQASAGAAKLQAREASVPSRQFLGLETTWKLFHIRTPTVSKAVDGEFSISNVGVGQLISAGVAVVISLAEQVEDNQAIPAFRYAGQFYGVEMDGEGALHLSWEKPDKPHLQISFFYTDAANGKRAIIADATWPDIGENYKYIPTSRAVPFEMWTREDRPVAYNAFAPPQPLGSDFALKFHPSSPLLRGKTAK